MTDKAKRLAEWKIIDVRLAASALASIVGSAVADGQVTETLTIPEGTIYRTTHFHEHGTDIPGHTTAIPAAELEALTKMRDQMACDLDEEGS